MTNERPQWDSPSLTLISRVEIIGPDGREHVGYYQPGITVDIQDGGRTLKIWVRDERSPY